MMTGLLSEPSVSLADDILINKDASAIGRALEVSSVIWH